MNPVSSNKSSSMTKIKHNHCENIFRIPNQTEISYIQSTISTENLIQYFNQLFESIVFNERNHSIVGAPTRIVYWIADRWQ